MGETMGSDGGIGVLETYAYTASMHERTLEGGFGSPRRSAIRLDGTGLQSSVPTIFSADTRTTLHRPYLGRKGIRYEVGPSSPTNKRGRGRGPPQQPWVEGAHRNDFHSGPKPYSVETDPDKLALTGVRVGKSIHMGLRDKTPMMGPKGLGTFADGSKRIPPSRSAKVIVQFDPPKTPELPLRAATATGGQRVRIRDQITERAQTPLESGAAPKREYNPHAEAPPTTVLLPSARPRTSGDNGTGAGSRPGTGGRGKRGATARRPRTVEGGGPRSSSALGLSRAAGENAGRAEPGGGGAGATTLGPPTKAGEAPGAEGFAFVRNSPEERFGACKQMHPQGLLAEERQVRPVFSLSGGLRERQFEEEPPPDELSNPTLRAAEFQKWKRDKEAISLRYREGSGNVVTWQPQRQVGTPPRLRARRTVESMANTRHAEMLAGSVAGGGKRPPTAAPAPRVRTPAWMANPKEMANIGRYNDTLDYARSKLVQRSELRAAELEARQQIIQCENQADLWGERARRERDKGAAEAAYHAEQKVLDVKRQQQLAREALVGAERELAALRAADGESRPPTGGGVLPAGMLETDLRRVMRGSTRLELIFILRSVGVNNTLYPDTKLHDLTHDELSNTVAASPIARGKFLEMMRRTPIRTVKHAGAGWLVAVDQGGKVGQAAAAPHRSPAEFEEGLPGTGDAPSQGGEPFETARSYDSYGGVNVRDYWRTGRRPHREHSVLALQRDIFVAPRDRKVITGQRDLGGNPRTHQDRPDGPDKPKSPLGTVPGAAPEDQEEG